MARGDQQQRPKWETQEQIHRKNPTLLGTLVPRLNQHHTPRFTPQQLHPISTHSFNSLLNESGARQEWRKKHVDENKMNERRGHAALGLQEATGWMCVCLCVCVMSCKHITALGHLLQMRGTRFRENTGAIWTWIQLFLNTDAFVSKISPLPNNYLTIKRRGRGGGRYGRGCLWSMRF